MKQVMIVIDDDSSMDEALKLLSSHDFSCEEILEEAKLVFGSILESKISSIKCLPGILDVELQDDP